MHNQLQAVAQGVPSFPCLLPFIMGCLIKNARAAPAAQIWTGEPAILPKDTLHLPLVARLLINTEDDGPLAGVPTQDDASSDAQANYIEPNSIETAAQSGPTFTLEERGGSGRSLPTPSVDEGPGPGRVLPTPTADVTPGTAQVIATLSRDGSSGQVLPTDVASVQDDSDSVDTEDQTGSDFPVDDGPGTALVVATPTRDGTAARSLPTDVANAQENSNPVDAEDQTEPDLPVDDGPGTALVVATLVKDGTTARSLPTGVAIAEGEESQSQSDSEDTVHNGGVKLRARDSGMSLSSVYLLLG